MNDIPTGPWVPAARGPFPHLPYTFGRYTLTRRIGGGGMGVVYEARDAVIARSVALKVPRLGPACPRTVRELFQREFQIGARLCGLQTLGICQIFDAGEIDRCPFFTMEFIRGRTLDDHWNDERRRLGYCGAAEIVGRIARVMLRVHGLTLQDETIVHRDLKPGNILVAPVPGEPDPRLVLLDFGLAFVIERGQAPTAGDAGIAGTYAYMPPEQMEPGWQGTTVGPWSDIYSLGAVLYRMLTGLLPFTGGSFEELKDAALTAPLRPPGDLNPLHRPFDDVCARALARHPTDRFPSMREFAEALDVLYLESQCATPVSPAGKGWTMNVLQRPVVPVAAVQFVFVPFGFTAPPSLVGQDRLFLDVGNRLAEGVIDHHHLRGADGPTAKLVRDRATLIDAAVNPHYTDGTLFTLVLHQHPDLDAVASTALALSYLATRALPPQADALIRYVEGADAGANCISLDRPFTLHSAFQRVAARSLTGDATRPEERWRRTVRDGVALIAFVLAEADRTGTPLEAVDAFAAPVLTNADRMAVLADADRYRAKLADPMTGARRCRLRLQGRAGGEVGVEGLVVRNVQNASDPARCAYFKDWARGDRAGSRDGAGFAALSVFMPEEAGHPRRCILSVTPGCGASLEGLGKLLDAAESERRVKVLGADDRKTDPATGARLVARPGYDNADPWYDGRGHDYTIVDAPRSGTLLTADEIEAIFLTFGSATDTESVSM